MKHVIQQLGSLFDLDVFLIVFSISQILRRVLPSELYRYYQVCYVMFLVVLVVHTVLKDFRMPSTRLMTNREKSLWSILCSVVYLSIIAIIILGMIAKTVYGISADIERITIILLVISSFFYVLFFVMQFLFIKKYW